MRDYGAFQLPDVDVGEHVLIRYAGNGSNHRYHLASVVRAFQSHVPLLLLELLRLYALVEFLFLLARLLRLQP